MTFTEVFPKRSRFFAKLESLEDDSLKRHRIPRLRFFPRCILYIILEVQIVQIRGIIKIGPNFLGRGQTIQIYGNVEGFPEYRVHCLGLCSGGIREHPDEFT